eukprot:scaffold21894_cov141-Isochrysis_galbana.AAC.1
MMGLARHRSCLGRVSSSFITVFRVHVSWPQHHHSSYTQLIHSAARGNWSWIPTDTHGLRPTLVTAADSPAIATATAVGATAVPTCRPAAAAPTVPTTAAHAAPTAAAAPAPTNPVTANSNSPTTP